MQFVGIETQNAPGKDTMEAQCYFIAAIAMKDETYPPGLLFPQEKLKERRTEKHEEGLIRVPLVNPTFLPR